MKKAYATIAIFLWLIALTTSAQNMYRNYSSPINVPAQQVPFRLCTATGMFIYSKQTRTGSCQPRK